MNTGYWLFHDLARFNQVLATGPISARPQEVRTLGAEIADFSSLDGAGKPLPPDSRA